MTTTKFRNEIAIALNERGVEVRADQMGDLLLAFERWPKGDWRPVFDGLADGGCQAEHWGYCLKGAGRVHNKDGSVSEIRAGQVYHVPPGHTFETLEDMDVVEWTRPHAAYEKDVEVMMANFHGMKAVAPPSRR
ncbi:MAG TPA: hypothetical protein VM889_00845 [Candidatus Thermoplasmatota archaeon]|nr:hypothetical protein [Candidatus Thermoplasmatota archaeon]